MNENKVKRILKKYEERRDENELLLEKRKKQVYNRFPQIKGIDDEISLIGLKLAKSVLTNPNDRESIVHKSREEIEALRARKCKVLADNSIPDNYLEMKYHCNMCKDKAFLPNGEKCNCFKQEIINEAYKMSNIENVLNKENFSNFNLEIFSTEKSKERGVSPRENIFEILTYCEDYVHNFNPIQSNNILFYGSTGLGKTYMCNCIAKDLLDKGYLVIYQTSFRILEILEDYKFRRDSEGKISEENYKNLFDCDLLIIDDLGTELTNTFTSSELFNIVNTRLTAGKSIIISTNLTPSQIGETYTQRTLSRILDQFKIFDFFGSDLRWERFK
ncbi:ATP-binding protein [Clostridioides mangenotii]|uniref:ATP-binding protein n=1 Tax=Metaclostridioides mangenotii TaxID=1540 RepID=UPI002149F822|nr:ATP-binding protein [Clostridioides mangenotii]